MPVGYGFTPVRAADQSNVGQSWLPVVRAVPPTRSDATKAAPCDADQNRRRRFIRRLRSALPPQEHAFELVLLAGLENGEDLITRFELRRTDGDLGAAGAHDGDQPCAVGQLERLDALPRGRRVAVDQHLDDLEVLA